MPYGEKRERHDRHARSICHARRARAILYAFELRTPLTFYARHYCAADMIGHDASALCCRELTSRHA